MTVQCVDNDHAKETYRSLIQLATFGLKFVQIVNGAAAIAILAYLGDVRSSGSAAPDLTYSMAAFVIGLVFGGVAVVAAYVTQLRLYNESLGRTPYGKHVGWLYTSMALMVLSLAAFAFGSLTAVVAFRG